MTKAEFYSELESILEMEAGTIKGDELIAKLPRWDSMAILSFIATADSKLGAAVSPSALMNAQTVGDLIDLFPGKIT